MELCHAEMEKGQNQILRHCADERAGNLIGAVALRDLRYWQICLGELSDVFAQAGFSRT